MIKGIEKYVNFMKEKHAVDISMFETSFLEKIIQTRMNALAIETKEDYYLILESAPGESDEIMHYLSNPFSEFFRNPLTFSCLEQTILPALIHQKRLDNAKDIRIWSAACASGQEAYSMAIIFDELADSFKAAMDCHIFATDINQDELDKARRGVYPTASVNKVSLKRINTYFTQKGEQYIVAPHLGKYIDFSIFDLLSGQYNCPPASIYGNFDLIFCTNLLFYYKPSYQQRIFDKVGKCLAPGGYLITGETEGEIAKENNYREIFINSRIFQKK